MHMTSKTQKTILASLQEASNGLVAVNTAILAACEAIAGPSRKPKARMAAHVAEPVAVLVSSNKPYGTRFLSKTVRNMVGHRRFDKAVGRKAVTDAVLRRVLRTGLKEIEAYDAKHGTTRIASLSKARCYHKVAVQLGVAWTDSKAPAKPKARKAPAKKVAKKATKNPRTPKGKVKVDLSKVNG